MYRVEVINACRCFLKSGFLEQQRYITKDEAKEEAEQMLQIMNSTFCHKHEFKMIENFGNYTINIVSKY
jgi:nucleoid DNA-binding protein